MVRVRAGVEPALGADAVDAGLARRGHRRATAGPVAERTEQWVSATRGGAQAEHRTTVSQREGLVLLAHSLGRRAQRAARGELGHRGLQVREARAEAEGAARDRLCGSHGVMHLGRLGAAVDVAVAQVTRDERGAVPRHHLLEVVCVRDATPPSLATHDAHLARQQRRQKGLELAAPAQLRAATPARTRRLPAPAAHCHKRAAGTLGGQGRHAARVAAVGSGRSHALCPSLIEQPMVTTLSAAPLCKHRSRPRLSAVRSGASPTRACAALMPRAARLARTSRRRALRSSQLCAELTLNGNSMRCAQVVEVVLALKPSACCSRTSAWSAKACRAVPVAPALAMISLACARRLAASCESCCFPGQLTTALRLVVAARSRRAEPRAKLWSLGFLRS